MGFRCLLAAAEDSPLLLDVRIPEGCARGKMPDANNVRADELRNRPDELPRDREIAAYW